jgi:hypothetical protein
VLCFDFRLRFTDMTGTDGAMRPSDRCRAGISGLVGWIFELRPSPAGSIDVLTDRAPNTRGMVDFVGEFPFGDVILGPS